MLEYDPYSYEIDLDPYPLYRRMRDEAPAYYNPRLDFWALTRFQDCHDAFLDWQTYSSAQGTVLELMGDEQLRGLAHHLHGSAEADPLPQPRLEGLHARRGSATSSRASARSRWTTSTGSSAARASTWCEEFTAKLPMDVISSLLGIPKEDRDRVRGWSNDLLHRDPGNPMPTRQGIAVDGRSCSLLRRADGGAPPAAAATT